MIVRIYDFLSAEKPKFSENLVGIVSDVTKFKYTRRAYDIGSFEMEVPTHANDAEYIQPDRMLIVGEKLSETYISGDPTRRIVNGTFLYVTEVDKNDQTITVTGYDLKYLFASRVTLFPAEEQDKGTYGYYVVSGTTFSCISNLINYNIINATDSDRQIFGMSAITMPTTQVEAGLTGIQDDRYMTRLEPLSTAIFNLLKNCKTHFYDVRLLIDDNADDADNYNPHLESSEDKPTIIIDESRYNIKSYTRKDGTSAYKNAIYAVSGTGDDVVVKCVKREGDTASGIKRKEVVLDVDTDSVSEIDRYAIKAAEDYNISDDFEIEPLFDDDDAEPTLAQKVLIRIDGVDYETVITEITDEYSDGKHTQSYVCGDKKLKVLNVLNKATAGNTQKIINNKINANSNAAIYNDPVIISQDTANYLEYKYEIVDYYAGDIVTFGQSGNPIIVQGNPVYKDAPKELCSGLTSSVAFNEYSESFNLEKISYDKDGNETGRTYKQTISFLKNGVWNTYVYTRSCAAGVEYLLRVTYDEICSPSDDYPYGCALIHTYGYDLDRSLDMLAYKTYCAFSSAVEYNAALNLTKSTLKKQSVSQTTIKSENYDSSANLPQIGVPDTIYTTTEPAAVWRYDSTNKKYVCVGRDYNEINEIKSDIYGADEAGAMKLPVRQLTKSTEEWKADSTIYPRGMMLIAQDIETELGRRKSVIRIANGIDTWSDLSDTNYLPIAASDTIGGVMIGDNISVTADGVISVNLSEYLKSAEISDWAKSDTKPTYTAAEVGAATAADITAAVNAVEIGGRNLLYYSRFDKKYPNAWAYSETVSYTFDGNVATLTKAETATRQFTTQASVSNGVVAANPNLLPENGCTYTISCEIMKIEGYDVGNGTKITNRYNYTDGTVKDFDVDVSGASETAWTKYSRTYTYASDKTVRYTQFIVALGAQACGIKIRNVKFEKGNKPTDWSPAPEDDERRITSLEARVAALEAAALAGGE